MCRIFGIILALSFYNYTGTAKPAHRAQEIDKIVWSELKKIGQKPRSKIDDYTFCRRIYLDTIGRIPTLIELDQFLSDKRVQKRSLLITKLLKSKGYNSHWYNYWANLLRVKKVPDKLHNAGNFSEWVKDSVRSNLPYDQMAHQLINARGELYKPGNGATGFYAREPMPMDHLANSVKTFLGLSVECAQCHNHPDDKWTQQDFYKLAAFTSKTHLRVDPPATLEKSQFAKSRKILKQEDFDKWIVYRESLRVKYASIYGTGTGYSRLPHDYQYLDGKPYQVMSARVPFGDMPAIHHKVTAEKVSKLKNKQFGPEINARKSMANWMTSPENPMFTKATVNRLWKQIMGSELVGPLGGLRLDSMGAHPALTQKLIDIMHEVQFDTKKFLYILFHSKIYQSSALALKQSPPKYLLDGPIVRRLPAEVITDSILSLKTSNPDASVASAFRWDGFTHFFEKSKKMTNQDFIEYSTSGPGRGAFYRREEKEAQKRNSDLGPRSLWRASTFGQDFNQNKASILLGASDRNLIDSANNQANIPQALFLMNGSLEQHLIRNPKTFLNQSIKAEKDHRKKREILWKAILCRPPERSEISYFNLNIQDLMWALLNSNEFKFSK